jgi:uncharacterized protein
MSSDLKPKSRAIIFACMLQGLSVMALAEPNAYEAYRAGKFEAAYELLLADARSGEAEAQYLIGLMYARGEGVQQDFYQAGKMYRSAAASGHSGAMVNLGSLFENCYGNGPCDNEKAAAWYRKAADRGNAIAQHNLSVMYATGTGVAQDEWTAKIMCRRAAEQGYLPAQYNLGVFYARGMGGPVDQVAAWAWYDLAATRGFEGAAQARATIAKQINPPEREKAQELSRSLLAAYSDS